MYYPTIDYYTFRENLHIYILLFSIIVVLTIFVYIKLAYPFWNIQPVYHTYDMWRTFNTKPFIIQSRFPIKTRYTDLTNVLTCNILDMSNNLKTEIIDLLQCHYLSSENSLYMFHVENFDSTFAGHLYNPHISVFKEKYFTKRSSNDEIVEYADKPIGCITSRPFSIYLKGVSIIVNYIDFLCVHREHTKRKLTRQLLQTHDYTIRKNQLIENVENPILVSLFKKEVELCVGIVPLLEFETPIYSIRSLYINQNTVLPPHFLLIEITDKNIDIVLEFLTSVSIKGMFDVFGVSNISNFLELIKSRTLYIYCLKRMDQIYTMYFFRDSRVQYENAGALLVLIASIQNSNNVDLFVNGFSMSLQQIIKKQSAFCFCMIENISHNNRIINILEQYGILSILKNQSAYYFYNYVVPTKFSISDRILIIV